MKKGKSKKPVRLNPVEENVPSSRAVRWLLGKEDVVTHTEEEVVTHKKAVGDKVTTKEAVVGDKSPTLKNVVTHFEKVDAHKRKDRHGKNRARLQMRVRVDIIKKIKQFCADNLIPIQDLIEVAVTHYLDNVVTHMKEKVGDKVTIDDLMMYKTSDDIIRLYQNHTGNRWKPKDDSFGVKYNSVDRRLVECGILNTLITVKGKKINSFEYFTFQINDLIEVKLPTDTLDIMLHRRREQWQQLKAQKFQT